jgi:hypothetical protein
MRPEELCGLLAEHDRLAVFAAVVLGASTPAEVSARSGLTARHTQGALRRLEQGGLISTVEGRLVAEEAAFKEAVREYGSKAPDARDDLDPDRAKAAAKMPGPSKPHPPPQTPHQARDQASSVLRVFVRAGRLTQIPVARGKRRIVLEHIAANFEPGVRYPERDVDAVLRAWHPDHASLRRYLIDEGLMTREKGVYWRSGGPVEV